MDIPVRLSDMPFQMRREYPLTLALHAHIEAVNNDVPHSLFYYKDQVGNKWPTRATFVQGLRPGCWGGRYKMVEEA